MVSVDQLIGKTISIISTGHFRYQGILDGCNLLQSTLTLRNVQQFGTEDRPSENFVPPDPQILNILVFKAQEIQDLHIHEDVNNSPSLPTPPVTQTSTTDTKAEAKQESQPKPIKPPPSSQSNRTENPTKKQKEDTPGRKNGENQNDNVKPSFRDVMAKNNTSSKEESSTSTKGVKTERKTPKENFNGNEENNSRNTNRTKERDNYGGGREGRGGRGGGKGRGGRGRGRGGRGGSFRNGGGPSQSQREAELKQNKMEFDFSTANSVFDKDEELKKMLENEKKSNGLSEEVTGQKTTINSFFDNITTAKSVGEGRVNPRDEKALNLDTFGVSSLYSSGRHRGGYYRRSSGRGRGRGGGHHQNGKGAGYHKAYYPRRQEGTKQSP